MIIYLNSTDQSAQDAALITADICRTVEQQTPDSDIIETIVVPNEGYTVDTIGIIYNTTDPLNPVAMAGWHANIMGDFTPEQLALLPTIPTPNNPIRMFAGM